MKQYRPRSWSQQARTKADKIVIAVERGWDTLPEAIDFFRTSYRAPIIRYRAAKRFGRIARKRGWQ